MAIKVTPPTISMYESRRRAPGRYRCALLSAALGLDLPQTLTLLRKTSNEGEDDEG